MQSAKQGLRQGAIILIALMMPLAFAGCELIGDILKVGFWAGAIFIILIVLIIGWLLKKMRGR